ncbi:phage protein [Clostridium baratii]|uniref:hypothetical protein n=1 Tax=Clostridium baratii TaxID=1561 RepID=UPI0006BB0D2B|nr:hypothetical protein [Clostridium baratii]CUO91744.1 phage protein [Clostridium baratii]
MTQKELIKLELSELGIDASDNKIDLMINKFNSKVINYCHIDSIPEKLKETITSMVVEFIKNEDDSNKENELKSIQEGDTTYTFQSKSIPSKRTIDEIILNHSHELNAFRKPCGFR